jgi:hypothetical protein
MKRIECLVFWLGLAMLVPLLNGQQAASAGPRNGMPDACLHLFTVGSGNNSLQYCVTDNGTISSIETPFGHPMLGAKGEGYGLCQESPAIEYHDYLVDQAGWGTATVLKSSKSTIKISRTTADGLWTLVQTITKISSPASAKVIMALTNNQSEDHVAYLLRFMDVDADGQNRFQDWGLASFQGAVVQWGVSFPGYGLLVQNAANAPFGYQQGFVRILETGPNACDFGANGFSEVRFNTASMELVYAGPVPAHQTLTVKMIYRAL